MLKLKALLQQHHLTQAALARSLQLSEATLAQIVNHNQWPKQGSHDLKARIQRWLGDQGVMAEDCFELVGHLGRYPVPALNKEDNMLLKKQVFLPATKKHFGLFRAPFDDYAVQSADDVFLTPDSRYAVVAY